MKTKIIALVITLLVAISAQAEFLSGNELLKYLRGNNAEKTIGLGYLAGVHDSMKGITHCPPAQLTLAQLRDMTLQYMDANPQVRHLSADTMVSKVLMDAFPCPKPQKSGVSL